MIAFVRKSLCSGLCIYNKATQRLVGLRRLIKWEKAPRYTWPGKIYKVDPEEAREELARLEEAWREQTKKQR